MDGVDGAVERVVGGSLRSLAADGVGNSEPNPQRRLRGSSNVPRGRMRRGGGGGMGWMERMEWIPRWFRERQDELAKRDFGLACT